MILPLLAVLFASIGVGDSVGPFATIRGVVVNGTHGDEPIGNADVVLRAGHDNDLEPVATIKTDPHGKFVFENLSFDAKVVYLPGADRDGVHYPANRIRLDPQNPTVQTTIRVFDAVASPSPLEALRHDIDVTVEPQTMTIHETLLVTNNSRGTYVGERVGDQSPVTLRLSIPANFDRVTFSSEFYGRRFRIVDQQLVTDIPWPPGKRELGFTYRIPLESNRGLFRRPLDIPCSKIILRVRGNNSEQVSCKLPLVQKAANETVFASLDKQLRAGHTIELQIGKLPVRWGLYARWSALSVLGLLILGSVTISRLRGRPSIEPCATSTKGAGLNSSLGPPKRAA